MVYKSVNSLSLNTFWSYFIVLKTSYINNNYMQFKICLTPSLDIRDVLPWKPVPMTKSVVRKHNLVIIALLVFWRSHMHTCFNNSTYVYYNMFNVYVCVLYILMACRHQLMSCRSNPSRTLVNGVCLLYQSAVGLFT